VSDAPGLGASLLGLLLGDRREAGQSVQVGDDPLPLGFFEPFRGEVQPGGQPGWGAIGPLMVLRHWWV
jgi:hypothetical protein